MTEPDWHAPVRCPSCSADEGRPRSATSKTAVEVVVTMRCGACAHTWTVERETPPPFPISIDRPSGADAE